MNLGTLDLVSIVPWEIITQLINLLLLFLLLKHFLFDYGYIIHNHSEYSERTSGRD